MLQEALYLGICFHECALQERGDICIKGCPHQAIHISLIPPRARPAEVAADPDLAVVQAPAALARAPDLLDLPLDLLAVGGLDTGLDTPPLAV